MAMRSAPPCRAEQQQFLAVWASDACTERERGLVVAAFETRVAKLDGGARRYKESLERIDVCLSLRRAQQAPLNAFLATAR